MFDKVTVTVGRAFVSPNVGIGTHTDELAAGLKLVDAAVLRKHHESFASFLAGLDLQWAERIVKQARGSLPMFDDSQEQAIDAVLHCIEVVRENWENHQKRSRPNSNRPNPARR